MYSALTQDSAFGIVSFIASTVHRADAAMAATKIKAEFNTNRLAATLSLGGAVL